MWLLGVILDNICGFFKVCFSRTLSKQIYRNCAVLMTGTVVVAVLVFTAGSFTGGGKNQVYAVKASRNAEEAGEGEANVKDKIVTLSTCTGNQATRFVVQGKRVNAVDPQ